MTKREYISIAERDRQGF